MHTLKALEHTGKLRDLIVGKHPEIAWQGLDITYHPPRVERVWCQFGTYRINLHRIYPCDTDEALFHPHPWPSAMHLLDGVYEMAVGYNKGSKKPPIAALIEFPAGSYYEMSDPDAWHYVRPINGPALTVMVSGIPWGRPAPKSIEPLQLLSPKRQKMLMGEFADYYKTLKPS